MQSVGEGIIGACAVPPRPPPRPLTGYRFCPATPVKRNQMAVFLLRAEHGASYVPTACTGLFSDVPCNDTFAPWIEELAAEGITAGCGGGNYCPQNTITRGHMAVFLGKTFGLP